MYVFVPEEMTDDTSINCEFAQSELRNRIPPSVVITYTTAERRFTQSSLH